MKRANFSQLKPRLQPQDKVRVMLTGRSGKECSYFNVIYVNKAEREVVLEDGCELFVCSASQFDTRGYFWSDEFETTGP